MHPNLQDEKAADLAKLKSEIIDDLRNLIDKTDALIAPRFSFVVYTVGDMQHVSLDPTENVYRVFGENPAYFADPAQARRVAAHFTTNGIQCSSATFRAWKAARVDFLKGMLDRLSK